MAETSARTSSEGSAHLYARTVRLVWQKRSLGLFVLFGAVTYAAGHAALALAGGLLARGLAGGGSLLPHGTSVWIDRIGGGDAWLGLATVGLAAAVLKAIGAVTTAWSEASVAGEVGEALRVEVLDGVLALKSIRRARHEDHAEVAQLASLTRHVEDVERGIAHGVLAEARAVVQLVPLGLLLACLAPHLATFASGALLSFVVFVFLSRRAIRRGHARAANDAELLLGAADEAVRHAELWATYGARKKIERHVRELGRGIVEAGARLRAKSAFVSSTSEVLGALALVLVLLASGGTTNRGAIVPFAVVFFMTYRPLRDLADARLARGRASEALRAALRIAGPPREGRTGEEPPARSWPLAALEIKAFRSLHGRHAELDLVVPAGRICAIVGPTGIGKTSLLRALLGLEPLRNGSISYGTTPLVGGVGPADRPFAWVPQDAPMLRASIEENVMLGGAGDPEAIFRELGGLTGASSGGEKQIISMARALATELPVILLDEPTSALDDRSEARVLRAIARLRGTRTVIIVTHRPAPLAICDQIVRLRHVEDAEHGPGLDDDVVGPHEIAIEHPGALAAREAELEVASEPVEPIAG